MDHLLKSKMDSEYLASQSVLISSVPTLYWQLLETTDYKSLLNGLKDYQTIIQLFKTCTIHELTHLFLSDVLQTNYDQPSDEWMGWKSDLSLRFTTMIKDILSSLTNKTSIPQHAYLISTMGTSQGDSAYYTQLHQQSLHSCLLPENAYNMQSMVSELAAFDFPSHYPTISPPFITSTITLFQSPKNIFKAWLTPVSTQWRKTIPTSSSTTHRSTYADNKSKDAIQNSPRPALLRFSNT